MERRGGLHDARCEMRDDDGRLRRGGKLMVCWQWGCISMLVLVNVLVDVCGNKVDKAGGDAVK